LDGEISELEEAALRRHLERCTACGALAAELTGLTELLRAAPLEEPRRSFVPEYARSRRRRPARRRLGVALAFAVSVGSAVAIVSLPTAPGLVPSSSALQFGNGRAAIQFELHKAHTLEPFLGVSSVRAIPAPVPDFSRRELR